LVSVVVGADWCGVTVRKRRLKCKRPRQGGSLGRAAWH
jgi:hypothetical protein